VENSATVQAATTTASPTAAPTNGDSSTLKNSARERVQAKLDNAKLKVCQIHEKIIRNRSQKLVDRATEMEAKFGQIATKVDTYYTGTLVPAGTTVPNHDELLATIDSKKAAVQGALTQSKDELATFDCAGDDPKSAMSSYRADMQDVRTALQDERTAVKDLIVAIRTSSGAAKPKSVQ
jgi:hypothetical protein